MIVTKIDPVTKVKYKVYIEEQFAFVLYKGELSRYGIEEGKEISQQIIEKIKDEVLLKRAKLRALHLLEKMDRTEAELRLRLKRDLYAEDIIEKAMAYVASFGYIGDENYTRRFVSAKQGTKSKKEIEQLLYQKGVARDTVKNIMEECCEKDDELTAIRRLAEKKHFQSESATEQEKKRIFDYLLRKGFSYEDIRQVIQVSLWNA